MSYNSDLLLILRSIFWQDGIGGLLNQADFFETVAKNTKIYCADVVDLKQRKIVLSSGGSLDSDVLLCGTGWLPSIQLFTEEQKVDLGLPHLWNSETPEQGEHWNQLANAADKKVTTTFPQFANSPSYYHREATRTPYRLYKHIAPVPSSEDLSEDRSIIFIGQASVGNYFPVVQCQAMWATAYMDEKLQQKELVLFTAWCR
jgi:dimethylaniline monooxygenase (N-oxide forming)